MRQNERGGGGRDTQGRTKDSRGREREWGRQRKKSERVREIARERAIVRERVREGERERKKIKKIDTYYATKCTRLHGMKHHTQSQSMFSFYLIKPYQPFSQTRTSTTHDQTTFSPSLRNYSISVSLDNAKTEFKNCIQNLDSWLAKLLKK